MDKKVNFILDLNNSSNIPLYLQLYEYIKSEIISGVFKYTYKLPSIRECSSLLNISKTTVENAYSQLIIEGYIDNIPKKGYYINEIDHYAFSKDFATTTNTFQINNSTKYINTGVDNTTFDISIWKKIYNRVFNEQLTNIYVNGDVQGEIQLRKEISEYVNNLRGGNTHPDQVIIGAGIQYLIGILIGILGSDFKSVAIEENGYNKAAYIFEDYNYNVDYIKSNSLNEFMEKLDNTKTKLLYISPSHQYPLGHVMPINQRFNLLNWAADNNSYIIEDDYDGIIRYDGKSISCLQGLDKHDSVIYLGSFSKTLLPALRISYMIIPQKILTQYNLVKNKYTQSTSKIDQIVLSIFMKDGHMTRHLRKTRKMYKRKSTLLANYIKIKYSNVANILNISSGFHIIFQVFSPFNKEKIIQNCNKNNILIEIIDISESNFLLSLNYSGIPFNKLYDTIDLILKNSNSIY